MQAHGALTGIHPTIAAALAPHLEAGATLRRHDDQRASHEHALTLPAPSRLMCPACTGRNAGLRASTCSQCGRQA